MKNSILSPEVGQRQVRQRKVIWVVVANGIGLLNGSFIRSCNGRMHEPS
jgi:hypothetical protein